jgi:hypothetical protein
VVCRDDRAPERFAAYRDAIERDPVKFASHLATLRQLERSDVRYVLAVVRRSEGSVEGRITTDGERVMLYVTDVGGPAAEKMSLNSRIAHELEHARQFDSGELALARDPASGEWRSEYESYDIGDEVAAWTAQLALASGHDFWTRRFDTWQPTLLRLFANERTDAARANLLARCGYARVNPAMHTDVTVVSDAGYTVGQLLRPDLARGLNVFGRVHAIRSAAPRDGTDG